MKFLFILMTTHFLWAQAINEHEQLQQLQQQGQLVSVRLSLGEPLRVYVVGREEAKVDLSKLTLTVRRLDPYPGKVVQLTKSGDYFTVPETMKVDSPANLELKTKVQGKEETFRFRVNQRRP